MAPECRRFIEGLGDDLDGTLAGLARLDFERHVGVCPRCQILRETVRKTVRCYQVWEACPIPSDVEARLRKILQNRMRSGSHP